MKKLVSTMLAASLLVASPIALVACGNSGSNNQQATQSETKSDSSNKEASGDVQMQYISPDDVNKIVTDKDDSYLIVDARKADDYKAGHIPGAISADMDKAKDGDAASGESNMSAALKEAVGSENGKGKKIVLVCYSGKRYAQAGTNALSTLGANMSDVYTLEGGMKAWKGETTK